MTKNIYTNQKVHGTQEITSDQTVNGNQTVGSASSAAKTQIVYGTHKVLSTTVNGITTPAFQQIGESGKTGSQTIYGTQSVSGNQTIGSSSANVIQTIYGTQSVSGNSTVGGLITGAMRFTGTGAAQGKALIASDGDGNVAWGDVVPKTYVKSVTVDNPNKKLEFKYYAESTGTTEKSADLSFVAGTGVELAMSSGALTISADTAFHAQIYDTLPTASESYKNTIALIPNTNVWTANTEYTAGTQVYRIDGTAYKYYQCATTHKSGSSFDTTEAAYWTQISRSGVSSYRQYSCVPSNEWLAYTAYAVNDIVYYETNGTKTYYKCSTAHTSGASFDDTEKAKWTVQSSGSVAWSWRQIGSTGIDLSNYVQLTKVGGSVQTMTTPLKIAADSSTGLALGTSGFRNVSAGQSVPSGGLNGDVYLQYGGTPHVGTETKGSSTVPIYLNAGEPTACSGRVVSVLEGDLTFDTSTPSKSVTGLTFAPKIVQLYEADASDSNLLNMVDAGTSIGYDSSSSKYYFTVTIASGAALTLKYKVIGW